MSRGSLDCAHLPDLPVCLVVLIYSGILGSRGIVDALCPCSVVVPYCPRGTATELAFLDSVKLSPDSQILGPRPDYWNSSKLAC